MNRKSKIFETAGIGLIAVAVWTVLIMLSDASPAEAYAMFFKGIFGNLNGFMEVFVKAAPLILRVWDARWRSGPAFSTSARRDSFT